MRIGERSCEVIRQALREIDRVDLADQIQPDMSDLRPAWEAYRLLEQRSDSLSTRACLKLALLLNLD